MEPQLYDDLLQYYLVPNNKPSNSILLLGKMIETLRDGGNISSDRNLEFIDTKIVNLNIVSRWIDKIDDDKGYKVDDEFIRELHLPYKYKLLLRGSQNGFTSKKFHELLRSSK